jgi:hypothetical protein
MSVGGKFRFASNPAEFALAARAVAVLAAVPSLLRFVEIEKIVRNLTPEHPRRGPAALPRERITYLCHRVFGLAGRLSYRPNCLRRALVHYHCLRLHGVPAAIHFGVKRGGGEALAGHCWLTVGGSLYDERPDMVSQFTHMFSLPASDDASPDPSAPGAAPRDVRKLSFGGEP